MFKRPEKPSVGEYIQEQVYPRGGWLRTARYHVARLKRVADAPHRVSRGVFAGVFVSFTPLFGVHFLIAPAIAWGIGGNIPASVVAVLFCNPLTFPFIAAGSLTLGSWMLNIQLLMMRPDRLLQSFWDATKSAWSNLMALFTEENADWTAVSEFFTNIFFPYLAGGMLLGLISGVAMAGLTLKILEAYQKRRSKWRRRRESRSEKRNVGVPAFVESDRQPKADRK